MDTKRDTKLRPKVSMRSSTDGRQQLLRSRERRNNSETAKGDESFAPETCTPAFDPKRLEKFSLGDFVELVEAAGMMPTGTERVMSVEEVASAPIEVDLTFVDRLRGSRFRFLVEHLFSGDRQTYVERLKENPNDLAGLLDSNAVGGMFNFLEMTRSLFLHLLRLRRREVRARRTEIPFAEPGQRAFTCFTMGVPDAWLVTNDGRLERRPFPAERDPTRQLVERLLKVLNGADPARFRRCAFEKCQRIFYAKSVNRLCCSSRPCNNNRLQRKWYVKYGKSAVYESANRREGKP